MTNLPAKPLLRVDELAIYWDVSERVVRFWVAQGKLPHVRIGSANGPIRIPRTAAVEFTFVFCAKVPKESCSPLP